MSTTFLKDMWRWFKGRGLVSNLLLVFGLALCSAPMVLGNISRIEQQKVLDGYHTEVEKIDESYIQENLEKAEAYNQALYGLESGTFSSGDILSDESYKSILNVTSTGIMGRVLIPAIDVDLPIYHGTEEDVLQTGVGHFQPSAFPIGGINTRCVLTGHRGAPNSQLFTRLDEIKENDFIFLEVYKTKIAYKVIEIETIKPEELSKIKIVEGKDLLTLITCTPYGINSHRLIVTAERVPYVEGAEDEVGKKLPSFRELLVTYLPLLFVLIILFKIIQSRRKKKNEID